MCKPLQGQRLLPVVVAFLLSAGEARGAFVAHEGFPNPAALNVVLAGAGHAATALTKAQVEAGALLAGTYDVFVVGRGTTFNGASALYVKAVAEYVDSGGGIVTEFSGMAMFFSSYATDVRPFSVTTTPQMKAFSGVVHGGSFNKAMTPINVLDPSHPTVAGLPLPSFTENNGMDFFFWPETADSNLHFVGDFTGSGTVGLPAGQRLPCLVVGCKGDSTFVFGTWDWADTVTAAAGSINKKFFLNSVKFVANGCNRAPVCNLAASHVVECQGLLTALALDGSGSIDPDGDLLTFSWSSDCPGATFDDPTSPTPVLTVNTGAGCSLACTVTLLASDGFTSSSASRDVTVLDSRAPVIALVGAGTMVLECNVDSYVEQGAVASDVCDPAVPVRVGGDPVNFHQLGTYRVTYDAHDFCGTDALQVVRTVEVKDSISPMFTELPNDLSLECEGPHGVSSSHPEVMAFLATAVVTDASGTAVMTHDAPETFGFGETVVTWTARDASGNQVSASRSVRVADTTAPTITRPADVTMECPADTSVASTGSASALDNCGGTTVSYSDEATSGCAGTGTISRTWTASDEFGNTISSVQTIRVVDNTAPEVTCSLEPMNAKQRDLRVSFSAWDGCGAFSVSAVVDTGCVQKQVMSGDLVQLRCKDFNCSDGGSHLVRLVVTATDECGNTGTCHSEVVIKGCGRGDSSPTVETTFLRGDADGDTTVTMADAGFSLKYHLRKGPAPRCKDAADCNDDGKLDLMDVIYLLNYLASSKSCPPLPFPEANLDPTEDSLGCELWPSEGHRHGGGNKNADKLEKKIRRKLARLERKDDKD